MKNPCGKTVGVNEPYEVYRNEATNFEWRVLKKWQVDDNKEYARWFVAAKSPATFGSYDMGDEYVANIKRYGTKVEDLSNLEKW